MRSFLLKMDEKQFDISTKEGRKKVLDKIDELIEANDKLPLLF